MKTAPTFSVFPIALGLALVAPGVRAQQAPAPVSEKPTVFYSQTDDAKRAEAYYNFAMGRMSEDEYETSGQSELANSAIEYYKKAMALDPTAMGISERLAEMYAKSQRIRDAVLQAQSVLKQDPDNLAAHRLLARIYVRTLGDSEEPAATQKETVGKAAEELHEILRIDPQDSESALWLARLYRFENEQDKAEEILRAGLVTDPGNEAILAQLSQLLLDQGRAKETVKLLEQAAGRTSSPGILDLLGDAYVQAHETAKAEEVYRLAVEDDPDDVNHRHGLAQALLAEDKYDEALEQFKKLTELEPDSADNYLRMSQIYRRMNKLDLAESNLLQAKQRAPGSLEVLYNESLTYDAQGRYEDAAHVLDDAIAGVKSQSGGEPGPNTLAILYEQLGHVYRDKEDYAAAERAYGELLKLGPEEQRRGRLLLIDAYRADHELDRALAEAKRALDAYPKDQDLKVTYAMLLGEKGQTDQATEILRGMLHGNDADRDVYLNIAQVSERGRRFADAEKAASTAEQLARGASEKETAWFVLGAIYERQKKYDEAEQEFRKVLEVNPNNAETLNYYGYMLADRGLRLEEATALIKRAVATEATNGAYLDSLGWAYYKQNRLAEAEESLRKAMDRSGHDPTILDHYGDIEAKLGHSERAAALWEKALAEWQKALPADYEAEKVNDLDKKLKSLKRRLAQKGTAGESKPQ